MTTAAHKPNLPLMYGPQQFESLGMWHVSDLIKSGRLATGQFKHLIRHLWHIENFNIPVILFVYSHYCYFNCTLTIPQSRYEIAHLDLWKKDFQGRIEMLKYQHPVEKNMYFSNLVEVAKYRAVQQGEKAAYIFLTDSGTKEHLITYRELDLKAKAIAASLQAARLSGERALLIYPPGLDFICAFFGCLYAGVIAVPIYPPINRQMMSIVKPVMKDSNPEAILTTRDILAKLKLAQPIQSFGEKSIFKIIGKGLDKFFPQLKLLNMQRQAINCHG